MTNKSKNELHDEHKALWIPLYKLLYIDDLETFNGLSEEELDSFKSEYNKEEINEIIGALKWGVKNPSYDFRSLTPGVQYKNTAIYTYIKLLLSQLVHYGSNDGFNKS